MKSAVMASMFTGTSLSACLVRVAERVSLADQPASFSVETMKGESVTVSLVAVGRVVALAPGAAWANASDGRPAASEINAARRTNADSESGEQGWFLMAGEN